MTGYADEGTWRQLAELARAVAVLPKPFKPEQLVTQVRAALDDSHSAA
jgi:response regulator RpfG family c-di-GMP phosphodiesterase